MYITTKEVAKIMRVSPSTVRGWIHNKKMPEPDIHRHKFVRWKQSTLEEFIKDPVHWREENDHS